MSLASRSATSGQKLHDVLSLGAYAFERHVDSVEFVRSCELPAGVALSPFAFSTVREAQRRKDADADVCVVARISSSPLGSASAEEPAELEYAAPSDRMFLPDGSMAPRRVPEPFTAVVPLPWLRRWAAEAADSEACDIAGAYARAAAAKAADVPAWPILETTAPPGQPRAETAHEDTLDSRVGPTLWSGPSVAAAGPEAAAQGAPTAFHSWDEVVASAEGHARWLGSIRSLGFAVLRGAPVGPDTVTRVNHLFGPVRETAEYGSVFDVRVEEDVWNFTFNSDALDVHSDNPYRDPSPTVQLLNCVIAAKSGGETMLVDAWRAAQDLGAEDPEALAILAATPLSFEFKTGASLGKEGPQADLLQAKGGVRTGHGAHLEATTPAVRLSGPGGRVGGVTFNSRSLNAFCAPPGSDAIKRYYEAYTALSMKLNDPARQLRFRLESGDVVLVINHRVLHGRTAFSVDGGDAKAAEATFGYLLPEGAKIPARWLTGTYADVDSLTSAHRTICHAIAGRG
ncbi:hypothetical protein FNF31_03626 [Cafeteria roenbergensis]|uniref:TauD/TfdA-like domain-containing protein n=1 Tax=Cafeteria roenbergensis TaxID=33653 RepID=A0A5A8CG46_CAFRO|nr:hypothetical protein FNF28_07114 [Cafeteria roenbergensis]KAA0161683.1 hypothetical protein FNF31_03626 [Cafeteria roenbergensis]